MWDFTSDIIDQDLFVHELTIYALGGQEALLKPTVYANVAGSVKKSNLDSDTYIVKIPAIVHIKQGMVAEVTDIASPLFNGGKPKLIKFTSSDHIPIGLGFIYEYNATDCTVGE